MQTQDCNISKELIHAKPHEQLEEIVHTAKRSWLFISNIALINFFLFRKIRGFRIFFDAWVHVHTVLLVFFIFKINNLNGWDFFLIFLYFNIIDNICLVRIFRLSILLDIINIINFFRVDLIFITFTELNQFLMHWHHLSFRKLLIWLFNDYFWSYFLF